MAHPHTKGIALLWCGGTLACMSAWPKIVEKYKGRWIALEDDEQTVIAAGKNLETTLAASASKGKKDPIVFRVPDEIVDFVGYEDPV